MDWEDGRFVVVFFLLLLSHYTGLPDWHSTPGGGGSAPERCLPNVNKTPTKKKDLFPVVHYFSARDFVLSGIHGRRSSGFVEVNFFFYKERWGARCHHFSFHRFHGLCTVCVFVWRTDVVNCRAFSGPASPSSLFVYLFTSQRSRSEFVSCSFLRSKFISCTLFPLSLFPYIIPRAFARRFDAFSEKPQRQ